jgi:hypothetical protein
MRYEITATCLSWIPPAKAEGVFSLLSGVGVTHRPYLRTSYSRDHAAVRAKASCQLDGRALLGAGAKA